MAKTKKKQAKAAEPKPAEPQPVAAVVTAIATVEPAQTVPTVKGQAAVDSLYPDPNRRWEKKELTHRQRLFVEAYLADPEMNATRAARKAGYRGQTAGCQLLRMHAVKREIEKAIRKRRKKFEITAENLLQELAAVAFFDPAEMLNEDGSIKALQDMAPHVRAAIRDIQASFGESPDPDNEGQFTRMMYFKCGFQPKLEAASLLARHLGLLADPSKPQVTQQTNILAVNWDDLYTPAPTATDAIEERLAAEERLGAIPAPSTPGGPASNGNGKQIGPSPRKAPK